MEYINKKYPGIGFAGILLGVFLFFVFGPFIIRGPYGIEISQTLLVMILLATFYLIGDRWYTILLGLCCAIPFLVLDYISIHNREPYIMAIAYVFYCFFMLLAMFYIGKYILLKRIIDTNLIFAVISLYIFSGMLWAKLYFLQDFIFPNSFNGMPLRETATNLRAAVENQFDFLYYSFGTITALGLGDITPKHHFARSLTVSEAIYGQLFVGIIISKMVSLWRNSLERS